MIGRRPSAKSKSAPKRSWRDEMETAAEDEGFRQEYKLESEDEEEVASPKHEPEENVRAKKPRKRYAWMNSDDESISASSDEEHDVPLRKFEDVKTAIEMDRAVADLLPRIDTILVSEVLDVCKAGERLGYFPGQLVPKLQSIVTQQVQSGSFNTDQTIRFLSSMAKMNAYESDCFTKCLEFLDLHTLTIGEERQKVLKEIFQKIKYEGDQELLRRVLMGTRLRESKRVCTNFFRGQCKWGARCRLSHDGDSFDQKATTEKWEGLKNSGSKGFNSSRDMYAADNAQRW